MNMDIETEKKISSWLKEPFDSETRTAVEALKKISPKELEDSFCTDLSFGTGGLRGLMGIGTNRLNKYTIRKTSQGLANYLKKQFPGQGISVVIGFDNRKMSNEFATEAANAFVQNGIDVFICKELRPTPFVSFACRYCKANAAVMITASHNPKEYNGYKVYWQDGAQVVAPHDRGILNEINLLKDFSVLKSSHPGTLHVLQEKTDEAYIDAIRPLQNYPKENKAHGKDLKIAYTSLHGTGITLAPQALADWGFSTLLTVTEQVIVDGDFPTVKFPNPEYPETLQMGIDLLLSSQSDLLLATDPDADRLGVAVLHKGNFVILNGNEIASICTAYLCEKRTLKNRAVVTSIVSTDLIGSICKAHGVACFEVLTGFKYIGEKIRLWETDSPRKFSFLFGAEESYGYLYGTHARDKDAIVSCCLIAEIALGYKKQGKTLVDFLYEIYAKYGVFRETTLSVDFTPGAAGTTAIEAFMKKLRASLPSAFQGLAVTEIQDYLKEKETKLPKSNVLLFKLEKGYKIVIRPSGTEPKLKIYLSLHSEPGTSVEDSIKKTDEALEILGTRIKREIHSL